MSSLYAHRSFCNQQPTIFFPAGVTRGARFRPFASHCYREGLRARGSKGAHRQAAVLVCLARLSQTTDQRSSSGERRGKGRLRLAEILSFQNARDHSDRGAGGVCSPARRELRVGRPSPRYHLIRKRSGRARFRRALGRGRRQDRELRGLGRMTLGRRHGMGFQGEDSLTGWHP